MEAATRGGRWHEIDAVFRRVLDAEPPDPLRFLADLDNVDESIRDDVARLLRLRVDAATFLETPPTVSPASVEGLVSFLTGRDDPSEARIAANRPAARNEAAARVDDRMGPWRIVGELGRGGMASVYLCARADGRYEQTAALKLLRRGLDTADIVRRFRAERQILSSLDHPGISRLLDGGATEDGRPYLVMERVDGTPITEWCDARDASIEQRLKLFSDVARAVHYAHTKLVVHRDIKPSNILVSGEGRVKLLDFGIAKLLDPDSTDTFAETRTGHLALTPEYAAPEQLRGDPATTATDVYQLGLLLHRLLSGARPREVRGPATPDADDAIPTAPSHIARRMEESAAALRDTSPRRLHRRLRGDLDAIVLAALEPSPERRYGSALALAEDVDRHLQSQPVNARRMRPMYRARKFLARNRWVMPVGATAVLLLGLYVFTLVRHGNELEAERNAARLQAARAERVRDILVGIFRNAGPWEAPDQAQAGEAAILGALEAGAERARSELANEPELQAELLSLIAGVYMGLGQGPKAGELFDETMRLERAPDRGTDVPDDRSAEPLNWHQGFESDDSGWYGGATPGPLGWCGSIQRQTGSDGDVPPSKGHGFAIVAQSPCNSFWSAMYGEQQVGAPWTPGPDYGLLSTTWPEGGFVHELDIYLDPTYEARPLAPGTANYFAPPGTVFTYLVNLRELDSPRNGFGVFHQWGVVALAGDGERSLRILDLNVTEAGWYTFRFVFRDEAARLAIDFVLVRRRDGRSRTRRLESTFLLPPFESRPTASFTPALLGTGYAWFAAISPGLALPIDEHRVRPTR